MSETQQALAALKAAALYLGHSDVQAIPFAQPASVALKRINAAIDRLGECESPKTPIDATVERGYLVIRIDVDRIADAAKQAGLVVESPSEFSKDCAIAMFHERENGSTMIYRFIANVIRTAAEHGSPAIKYLDPFDMRGNQETWK
jgi:hypothetical protein